MYLFWPWISKSFLSKQDNIAWGRQREFSWSESCCSAWRISVILSQCVLAIMTVQVWEAEGPTTYFAPVFPRTHWENTAFYLLFCVADEYQYRWQFATKIYIFRFRPLWGEKYKAFIGSSICFPVTLAFSRLFSLVLTYLLLITSLALPVLF